MLSISDWIAFLTSEKNANTCNIFSLSAVIIAVVALIMSVSNSNWAGAVASAVMCASLMFAYYVTTKQYEQHAKEAGKLLKQIMLGDKDIMSGKERDPSKIEERWNKYLLEQKSRKWKFPLKGKQKNKKV